MNANPTILVVTDVKESTSTEEEANLLISMQVPTISKQKRVQGGVRGHAEDLASPSEKGMVFARYVLLEEALDLSLVVGQVIRGDLDLWVA